MKDMKRLLLLVFLSSLLFGCASPNVELSRSFWQQPKQKVKVAADKMPKAALYKAGGQGLLDVAISDMETNGFSHYLTSYNLSSIYQLRDNFAKVLRAQKMDATVYPNTIDVGKLTKSHQNSKSYETRDFTSLAIRLGKTKLLIITVQQVGAIRRYYGFIPLGAPSAICYLKGDLIDLTNNKVLWRYHSQVTVPVQGEWDQSPNYPNFSKALRSAIQQSENQLLDDFTKTANN